MPNKLIGQRFQINDRVSRKNYSVIANTYKKKYGNITETIERKNSAYVVSERMLNSGIRVYLTGGIRSNKNLYYPFKTVFGSKKSEGSL